MTTTQIVADVVDAELLAEITGDVFAGMFGEDSERPFPAYATSRYEVSSSVDISGGWNGTVTFSCSLALARWAVRELLGVGGNAISLEDVADLVGEIVNVVGGNIKSLLPGPSALSLPHTDAPADVPTDRNMVPVDLQWRGHSLGVAIIPERAPVH